MPAVDTAAAAGLAKSHKERARKVSELRAELSALRLSGLRKRAVGAGLDSHAIDAAVDSDDAKGQLIALVVGTLPEEQPVQHGDGDRADLQSELIALRLTTLHKRAMQEGVDSQKIDNALSGNLKAPPTYRPLNPKQ